MSDSDEAPPTNRQLLILANQRLELVNRKLDTQVVPKIDKMLKAMGQAGMIEPEAVTENEL